MDLNGDRLIRLSTADTKLDYLAGFWRWVELLAADEYSGAIEALHRPRGTSMASEGLKKQVTTEWHEGFSDLIRRNRMGKRRPPRDKDR